ncbi:AfsR/SARP family transcriptional regulator [Streptomyces sp. NBC_01498]|uniref:AfsR/SARP family transcriptional regulator n=1 Tax=Streptomyces sp. NBC_01498 TaxID=2975870 RepID=UPI002E7C16F5|nr:AfsR/SARP family transcriptional regulator [Streptomyces sp. NBC_01498]WTL23584.1 AfsR/SARP family transcriptional regulator [Streptomyces sp. NBC_01498]
MSSPADTAPGRDPGGAVGRLPSAPKTRQLLALLLLHTGTQVTLETCVHELWGDHAPRSAVQSVHTRVFQLRRALAARPSVGSVEAAKRVLETRYQGYVLHVRQGDLDLHAWEGHMARARRALAADDDVTLAAALRSALALWRGRPLVDVEAGRHIQAQVAHLEGVRLTALEQCLDAELRLGLHHQLLSELGLLISRYPTHENLHAQYMIALYRCGRTAQALEVYRVLSRHLADELGIEPSHKLRTLQTAVLTENAELDVRPPLNLRLSLDLVASR